MSKKTNIIYDGTAIKNAIPETAKNKTDWLIEQSGLSKGTIYKIFKSNPKVIIQNLADACESVGLELKQIIL